MNPKHIFASQMSVPVGTTISDGPRCKWEKYIIDLVEITIADTFNFGLDKSDGTSDFKDEDNHKWTHMHYQIHVLTIALYTYRSLWYVSIYYW